PAKSTSTSTPTPTPKPTPKPTSTAATHQDTFTPVAATAKAQPANTGAKDSAIAAQVKSEVVAASNNGADAAQLMTIAHQRAVELVRQQYPSAGPSERMDRAVAIATYVLNGPGQIDHLSQVDSGQTKTVQYMRDIAANDPGGNNFAQMGLDHTHGGGTFYDGYSDHTDNQAFHTNFFVAAGYVAGGDLAMVAKAQAGNIYHETLDPDAWVAGGGSMADFAASSTGIVTGQQLWKARAYGAEAEAGKHADGRDIDLLEPVFVAGFVSDAGTPAPNVAGMSPAQRQGATQLMQRISDLRASPLYQLATEYNPGAYSLIPKTSILGIIQGLQSIGLLR
ncbi:MAG TPA: hypothetical protein VFA20_27770, partial [Myxococcaceae bacterium]|nr:hypothetical protein [Myxococcaceae bacterium]